MFYTNISKDRLNNLHSMYKTEEEIGSESLQKAEESEMIIKGRKAEPIGSRKTWGTQEYVKTAAGWTSAKKAKDAHDTIHGGDKKEEVKHKIGDYVKDEKGEKGKVTQADDKEVAVEHENGDVSGYEHHQVKKQDSADHIAQAQHHENEIRKEWAKGAEGDHDKVKEHTDKISLHHKEAIKKIQEEDGIDEQAARKKMNQKLFADHDAKKAAATKEDKSIIGKTKSGKNIHDTFEHEGHKDFTADDHYDAYSAHATAGKKSAENYKKTLSRDDLNNFQNSNKQANKHSDKYVNSTE